MSFFHPTNVKIFEALATGRFNAARFTKAQLEFALKTIDTSEIAKTDHELLDWAETLRKAIAAKEALHA